MKITYQYGTIGPVIDLRTDAEVPSMNDHNDHTNWLKGHEDRLNKQQGWLDQHGGWLRTHDQSIDGVTKTVVGQGKEIWKHTDRIWWVEQQVNRMPQLLRDSLCETLIKEFGEKFEVLEKQVLALLEERNQMAAQLTEVQRQRDEVQRQLDTLKGFFEKSAPATRKKV